jgi:predicted nucleic acid-binding protein
VTPAGWVLDTRAAVHAANARIAAELALLAGRLFGCPIGALEQLYAARSAAGYDALRAALRAGFGTVAAPADVLDRALQLRADLAHHHGMWHRTPVPDLLIAEVARHRGMGVVTVDSDFARIAEVRPLVVRRLSVRSPAPTYAGRGAETHPECPAQGPKKAATATAVSRVGSLCRAGCCESRCPTRW